MADIFLSCVEPDFERVALFVSCLEAEGYSVACVPAPADPDTDEKSPSILDEARCVVVFWSAASASHKRIRREAAFAQNLGLIVPVRLDDTPLPRRFERDQMSAMKSWTGDTDHPQWRLFLARVRALIGPPGLRRRPQIATEPSLPIEPGRARRLGSAVLAGALLVGVGSAGGYAVWNNWKTVSDEIAAAVADPAPEPAVTTDGEGLAAPADLAVDETVRTPQTAEEKLAKILAPVDPSKPLADPEPPFPLGGPEKPVPADANIAMLTTEGAGAAQGSDGFAQEGERRPAITRAGEPEDTDAVALAEVAVEDWSGALAATDWTNVRAGPGVSHAGIGILAPNQPIIVVGKVRGRNWYKVELPSGQEGFVFGGLLRDISGGGEAAAAAE
ncbi:MAG: SH3 domain-containing protein [Pseudomonadota bacterium]